MSEKAQKVHLKKVYSEQLGMKAHEELTAELAVEEQPRRKCPFSGLQITY